MQDLREGVDRHIELEGPIGRQSIRDGNETDSGRRISDIRRGCRLGSKHGRVTSLCSNNGDGAISSKEMGCKM